MLLPIQTTARLSNLVALEILNVAINGACERWAEVTEAVRDMAQWPNFGSAKFSLLADPSQGMTVTAKEVAAGIQHLLTEGYPCAGAMKQKVLKIVANDEISEVDAEAASSIVRAAIAAASS